MCARSSRRGKEIVVESESDGGREGERKKKVRVGGATMRQLTIDPASS